VPVTISGSSEPVKKPWLAWTIATLSVLIALALGFALFRKPVPGPTQVMRFEIPFPDKVLPVTVVPFSLSPDGRHLVFAAVSEDGGTRLWLRSLEALGRPCRARNQAIPRSGRTTGVLLHFSAVESSKKRICPEARRKRYAIYHPQDLGWVDRGTGMM
jgi:hypothetical protein